MVENFIKKIQRALRVVGYVASEKIATQIALLLSQNNGGVKAMLLDGPPGAGKTFLAKSIAMILGVDYIYVQAHPGSCPEDFLYDANIVQILRGVAGDSEAVKSAEDVIELGFLPRIFKQSQKGVVVAFVDELDKTTEKNDSLFLAALQEGEVVVKGLGLIKANLENLILFFTKNDERQISEPLMRRCRREYLSFPKAALEMAILTGRVKIDQIKESIRIPELIKAEIPEAIAKVLITVANKLRDKQEDLIKPPATSELMAAGKDVLYLYRWGRIGLAGEIVFGWLAGYQEDQEILRQIITPEKLGQLLTQAVRSAAAEIQRIQIKKPDNNFIKFGKEVVVND